MKYWFYLIALLVVSISCRPKPIDIDVPEEDPKLVISSISVPDRLLVINVSRSFSALKEAPVGEDQNQAILDQLMAAKCEVHLSNGSQSQKMINLGSGMYVAAEVLREENQEYSLSVYDPESGQSVSAKTLVPPVAILNNVTALRRYRYERYETEVDFSFTNVSGGEHYLINCYANSDEGATYENFALQYGRAHSELVRHTDQNEPYKGSILLRDWESDTVFVSLSQITPEYYQYLEARLRATESVPFLSEPVSLPSNVEGGYGFFTAHFPDARIVTIKPE